MKKATLTLMFLFVLPLLACGATDDTASDNTEASVIFKEPFQKVLRDGWSWLREVPANWRITDDALELKMEPLPGGGARNILFRKPPTKADGPFVVTIEIKALQPYTQQFQQAGLYWMQGDELKLKFVMENIDDQLYVFPGKKPLETEHVVLRWRIDGTKLVAEYQPGATGEFLKAFEEQLPDRDDAQDRISIQCWHGPADTEAWIRFQKFSITKPESK